MDLSTLRPRWQDNFKSFYLRNIDHRQTPEVARFLRIGKNPVSESQCTSPIVDGLNA